VLDLAESLEADRGAVGLMDPLATTLAMVLASKALEGAGSEAGKDAWAGLTSLIRKRFGRQDPVIQSLQEVEHSPQKAAAVHRLATDLSAHAEHDPQLSSELATWIDGVQTQTGLMDASRIINYFGANFGEIGTSVQGQVVFGDLKIGGSNRPKAG
jgi:hypothetical protein